MATLYNLADEYRALMLMAEDDEVSEEAFTDTLDMIEGEIEDKADGYAKVIRMMSLDVEAMKTEEQRIASRRRTVEARIDRMKKHLQAAMELTGKVKFKTALFSFGIQNNPASVVMDTTDNIPEQYLRYKDPEIDRKKIMEDLKAGVDLSGLAHLEQTRGLRIR